MLRCAPGRGPATLGNYQDEVLHLTTGCAVSVTGTVAPSQGKGQAVELLAEAVVVVGWVDDPETYPISPKRHTFEYLREVAHLRVRTNTFGAVARVRHCLAMAMHRYLDEHGFYWVHTPILTASDAEGAESCSASRRSTWPTSRARPRAGSTTRRTSSASPPSSTVSGQLNIEAYCLALTNVYTFGPTFRAENSNTSRHLSEFWMIEPEIAFADISDNADLAEELLRYSFRAVLDERADDMAFFADRIDKEAVSRLEGFVRSSFARMEYAEAIEVLERAGRSWEFPVAWGIDLQSEHERYLTEEYAKRPVVVVNYPKQIKAFYMRLNDDGRTVAAMDVLAPGIGEIVGGSQREERLDVLDARIREMGLDPAAYWWYRDLRRYGTVPHAGFGLGFDRAVAYATGMANIRDVIPFPRTPASADF